MTVDRCVMLFVVVVVVVVFNILYSVTFNAMRHQCDFLI